MFGLRLKSWMEAHLGRPRQKSSHQNQKSHRAPKDSSGDSSGGGSSGSGGATTNNTTTTVTSSLSAVLSSSSTNPHPGEYSLREQNSNLYSSPSSDFSSTTSPSNSSVQIQSGSVPVRSGTAQLQKNISEHPDTKDHEAKLLQEHHQRTTCTRSSTTGSVSNSVSNSILLGSFSNNLSSPDTGYSTDGYSPKSVYPALSFESSGKSTPKSSYTISSLVSSELLNSSKHTASLSSASCSVQNGLESDHECASPLLKTSASLPPHSETDRSKSNANLGLGNGTDSERNSQGDSPPEHQNQPSSHSHSITHENKPGPATAIHSSRDISRGNDNVTSTQCNPTKSSVNHLNEFSSHLTENIMVAPKHTLSSFSSQRSQSRQDNNETCKGDDFRISSPFSPHRHQSSSSDNNQPQNLYNHRRTESLDDRKSSTRSDTEGGSNSSSVLTAPGNRNIRTSFVLVTAATSQIPECNSFGLKNAFSICSPRKERTRIKTNPWITLSQYNNDGNSNANMENNPPSRINSAVQSNNQNNSPPVSESRYVEKVNGDKGSKRNGVFPNDSDNQTNVHNTIDSTKIAQSINNKGGTGGDRGMDQPEGSTLVYRISTSTSASDSGKGSLDPGTNRNSTESSCLLSDSASTRNSIISHEAEPGCSESRSSSSSATPDMFSNGHGTFFSNGEEMNSNNKSGEDQSYHQFVPSTPVKVIKVPNSVSLSSAKSTPNCVQKFGSKPPTSFTNNDNSNFSEPKSEQDVTCTSITLPPELITSGSGSAHGNVIMVDKETDILSDWANTDEDGEDEIETDRNENDDRVTPTPSSPDTDTGRAIFPNSHSTSSATDIDFGDSSAATQASSTGIVPSSSVFRHHYTQNVNKYSNPTAVAVGPYHHHNIMNMNPSATCYQPIQIVPTVPLQGRVPVHNFQDLHDFQESKGVWNQSEVVGNQVLIHPSDVLSLTKSGVMCPTGHTLGISNANISLSSLYSNASQPSDNSSNKPQSSSSNAIARGALGFLRKIFKKGSCSSHRTSPGSDKSKMSRSSKSKDSNLDNIPSITGLRSPLLTADALVSHPLVGRKPSVNGYFLTPTPNAFRRRSGTGTDSSDSKGSKHHKPVKTDIIRLPPGALSPTQLGHYTKNSSSSTSSSKNTSIGAFCISSLQNNTYAPGNGNNIHGYSNTNTNSTTASSVHSMSTSTSAASTGGVENHANGQTPRQNQSRLNENFYPNSNSNSSRQSPFMSDHSVPYPVVNPIGTHSKTRKPQPPALPPVPIPILMSSVDMASQSPIIHQQRERDFLPHQYTPKTGAINSGVCPYESPRLPNPQTNRINSPSFNNYSPIHRLVVTSGSHLLSRSPNPSSQLNSIHIPSASTSPFNSESPRGTSRNGNTPTPQSHVHSHNNTSTFTPNINRCVHPNPTSSPSLLINHHQSISSPRPHLSSNPQPNSNSHTFTSPSPILRNPRYQYITSSNQNSPVLNVPKRINVPPQNQQQYYYHHNQGHGGPFPPTSNPNGPPPFSTFSPTPPPRQNSHVSSNNNPFSTASPNLNHHNLHLQNTPTSNARHRSGSLGCEFETVTSPNLPPPPGTGGGNLTSSSTNNRNNILSRSQSYQTHQMHYYASSVVPQPPSQIPQTQRVHQHPLPQTIHPTSLCFNEPPLLMRTHLHNQNVRLNNFLMNKQRLQQTNAARRFPNSESFPERIYETMDSEDEEYEENSNDEELIEQNNIDQSYHPNRNETFSNNDHRHRLVRGISDPESEFHYPNKCRVPQSSKSKRSKPKPPQHMETQNPKPRPPVPMALFGPNTFLSETETRLLEADREADRKYKRLINEAEALLREISAVKSQQPWAHPDQQKLRVEDCPQSDPLRRKAYDCWALRRLQQELAGCCASPPVLHRSRMNLQSPSTPTAGGLPFPLTNLSLSQNSQIMNQNMMDNNQNNAHF